jgi:hypothetical protein
VAKFRLAVINVADARICLDQLCQVTDVSYETEREFFCGPRASVFLDRKPFV